MRVCIVYDCLYPYTVGGAERWYRNLAQRLTGAGDDVTFRERQASGRFRLVPGSQRDGLAIFQNQGHAQ